MTAHIDDSPVIGPDHQLPAHVPRRPRLWVVLVVLGLLVVGIAATVMAVRRRTVTHRVPAPPPAVPVTTTTSRKGDIAEHLEAIGTVTPVHTASITSQVNGLVTAVHYKEGQRVEQGDPLVDIDPRPYRATLLQAQGTLERDQNLLAEAQMDLERYRIAWSRNAVAKQTLEDQEKVVEQDRGVVKNDQGIVQYDQVQLDFCHITSPLTGRVGLRLVDPGNVVQASANVVLAVVTQIEPITVVFAISEDSLGAIRKGDSLAVDAFDRTNRKKLATGVLTAIDNQIDTTTGTVRGRATFDNKDDALFPNQFVNVRVLLETRHDAILVPASAIQQNGSESFVYVVQDGVAHMRKVKADVTDEGVTQVEGIDADLIVANSGFDRLHDGAKVAPSAAPPPAGSTSAAP